MEIHVLINSLSITHDIYKSFDAALEIGPIVLDILKSFDSVAYKLRQHGFSDVVFLPSQHLLVQG